MGNSRFRQCRLLVAVPILIPLFLAGNAFCFPCNEEPAYPGDTMKQVAAKCGDAVLQDRRTVTREEENEDGVKSSTVTNIDEWTYDVGSQELAQSYRFENGKLVEIRNRGYGRARDFSIDTCRNGGSLSIGDSMIDAFLKCGAPLSRDRLKSKIEENEDGAIKRRTFVPVVEWTYRYGPDAPGYTVTFENCVATGIRTREFGK